MSGTHTLASQSVLTANNVFVTLPICSCQQIDSTLKPQTFQSFWELHPTRLNIRPLPWLLEWRPLYALTNFAHGCQIQTLSCT